jgi:hypothetical protein
VGFYDFSKLKTDKADRVELVDVGSWPRAKLEADPTGASGSLAEQKWCYKIPLT